MAYSVRFVPAATRDLKQLYDFIAASAGDRIARDFVERLHRYCLQLDMFPQRGTLRNDIRPGLRILGYRRQATIAFTVHEDAVMILRVFGRGRDFETGLREWS